MLAPSSAFALAGAIVQPTGVSSPDGQSILSPLVNTINQSGLGPTYTSGTTNFNTYTATATHTFGGVFSSNYGQSGTGNVVNNPVLFTFNLGQVVSIDALAYWISNTGTPSSDNLDVQNFQLFAGTDDTGTLLGTYSATQGNLSGVSNAQIFTFAPTSTQFITLKATSVFDPGGPMNEFGNPIIGEVAFREVPEPLTMLGVGTAAGFGAFFKRKLNQKSKQDSDKA